MFSASSCRSLSHGIFLERARRKCPAEFGSSLLFIFFGNEVSDREKLKILRKQLKSPHSSFGSGPSCGGDVTFSSKWFCQPVKCQPAGKANGRC